MDMFQAIAAASRTLSALPAPSAAWKDSVMALCDSYCDAWTRTEKFESVCFGLTLCDQYAFRRAGFKSRLAQSDVHLHLPSN
jgi:hypothetical protein